MDNSIQAFYNYSKFKDVIKKDPDFHLDGVPVSVMASAAALVSPVACYNPSAKFN